MSKLLPPELVEQMLAADAIRKQRDQDAMQMEINMADLMGPDFLKQQAGLGTLDQRADLAGQQMGAQNSLLEKQLAMANAIRNRRSDAGSTAGGAILGGLGDLINGIRGDMMTNDAMNAMKANQAKGFGDIGGIYGQQDAGRAAFAKARLDAMRGLYPKQQSPQATAAAPPASSYGEGVEMVPFELPQGPNALTMDQLQKMKLPTANPSPALSMGDLVGMKLPYGRG